MAKNRKRGRGNPVREWFSDNLRYLLLVLVIVVAALAAFLIYREVSDRRASGTSILQEKDTSAEGTRTVTASAISESAEETSAVSESKTEVVTATPTPEETPTPTPTPTPTEEPEPEAELTEGTPGAAEAVQSYFWSLQSAGENENVEYYSDAIRVQTVPGPTDGTYIAYADYTYKYWNFWEEIPGLTEFYLAPDEDGVLQVITQVPTDVQASIVKMRQTEAVQALIRDVQDRYQAVLDADPDLDAFISGLE